MSQPAASYSSIEEVANRAKQWLEEHGESDISIDLESETLSIRNGTFVRSVNLTNLLARCRLAPEERRPTVFSDFLQGALEVPIHSLFEKYTEAQRKLRPIVRDAFDGVQRFKTALKVPDAEEHSTKMRPSLGDMLEGLVVDQPHSMLRVTPQMLKHWGVTFEEAWDQAMLNLRASTPPIWRQVAPDVWSSTWNDGYDSSRILLPELAQLLMLQVPVAIVPAQDVLFVAEGANPQAMLRMAQLVEKHAREVNCWVSFQMLTLANGQWHPMEPPAAVATVLERLNKEHLAMAYDSQSHLLVEMLEAQGKDIFVASQRLMEHPELGLKSFTVWSQGVPTLLPRADMVAFVVAEKETPSGVCILPWKEMFPRFGALLEPQDYRPLRYQTLGFPSRAELEAVPGTAQWMPGKP